MRRVKRESKLTSLHVALGVQAVHLETSLDAPTGDGTCGEASGAEEVDVRLVGQPPTHSDSTCRRTGAFGATAEPAAAGSVGAEEGGGAGTSWSRSAQPKTHDG